MGLSHSTARWASPAAFLLNFAAQNYGMLSSPNMKDIHDANLSFFSPQPYFIAAFFFPQQLFQIGWLYRLWKMDPKKNEKEAQETQALLDYVPFFCAGNLCIAAWMLAWNNENLGVAHAFVTLNTFSQLYYMIVRLSPMDRRSVSSILTHVVVKTFAGIGILDFLHNGSVAFFKDYPATLPIEIMTGVGFGLASAASDWIFGGCLVYDLVAIAVGQGGSWGKLLGGYAAACAAIVGVKNWARPPYEEKGYQPAEADDDMV